MPPTAGAYLAHHDKVPPGSRPGGTLCSLPFLFLPPLKPLLRRDDLPGPHFPAADSQAYWIPDPMQERI